ncbi:MAG: hypothetical protein ACD_50C00290G0006 [uncultured bacterium]|nr:MAG: hypothetical protein ACD_50C00290G0006 [uncultured bacterium]OGH13076.1 MAG: hypothetical protein A2687_00240 [Candidatus Levybacteria bacterium RIFCSPHIGHO2_01_FULL_38_26]
MNEDTGRQLAQKEATPNKEVNLSKPEVLLIFGQGPVIDNITKANASESNTQRGQEDINFWSRDLALAACILFEKGAVKNFAVMGGPTGGQSFASEAELIKREMTRNGVPEESVEVEVESTDTIRNIVNYLGLHESPGEAIDAQAYNILTTSYHSRRVNVLMKLFALNVTNSFTSSGVFRFNGRTYKGELTEDSSKWDSSLLNELDARENMDDNRYYSDKKGTERRPFSDRFIKEAVWTREIMERPEIFLQYINRINNNERIEAILDITEKLWPGLLKSKYNIDRNNQGIKTIKSMLPELIGEYHGISEDVISRWENDERSGNIPVEVENRLKFLG